MVEESVNLNNSPMSSSSGLIGLVMMRIKLNKIIEKQEQLKFVTSESTEIDENILPLNDYAMDEISGSLNDVDELLSARATELPELTEKIGSQKMSIGSLELPFKDLVVEAVDKITSFPADVCSDLMDIQRRDRQEEIATDDQGVDIIAIDAEHEKFASEDVVDSVSSANETDSDMMLSVLASTQGASAIGQDSSTYSTSQNDNDGFEELLFDDTHTLTNATVPVLV